MSMVQIKVLRSSVHRPGRGWEDGKIVAEVGDQYVTYNRKSRWRCSCTSGHEEDCAHITQVAALIHPDVVTRIDERLPEVEPRPPRVRVRNQPIRDNHPARLYAAEQAGNR